MMSRETYFFFICLIKLFVSLRAQIELIEKIKPTNISRWGQNFINGTTILALELLIPDGIDGDQFSNKEKPQYRLPKLANNINKAKNFVIFIYLILKLVNGQAKIKTPKKK